MNHLDLSPAQARRLTQTPGRFVIILSRDADGPVYLGKLDVGRQGVRRLDNAIRYKTRTRAQLVAATYGPGAVVALAAEVR